MKRFSLADRLKSFRFAFRGLQHLIRHEHNARIHLFAAACAIILGFIFNISALEWIALAFSIGLVFITEIINTAIEKIADQMNPGYNLNTSRIKDLAAASVLMAAIVAIIAGLLIFLPKII